MSSISSSPQEEVGHTVSALTYHESPKAPTGGHLSFGMFRSPLPLLNRQMVFV
jgi:hypothetical protein